MDNASFKKLQQKWYEKLAKSGFQDIEDLSRPYQPLKTWDSFYFRGEFTPAQFEERRAYFERAERAFNKYPFKTALDKQVWYLHSQGHTIRETSVILAEHGIKKSKTTVFVILKRLKKELQWY